jgi:hypothetical protein
MEAYEPNMESGEADDNVRDDGHFYRDTTLDEGTGCSGEEPMLLHPQ